MNEMTINLNIDSEKNIVIKNSITENSYIIEYNTKEITAQGIYDVLSYKPNAIYKIENNIEKVTDENTKVYFQDVIDLVKTIIDDINVITNNELNDE
ncbi:MAG: hypothetical protein J6K21_04105 [Bacilli bacterium]|nr:hypothetical protein [Bacilli bacterium]